jgi:hypothetical protein
MCCLTLSPAGRADEPNPLDKLIPLWKSQRTEIASAHLKYRLSQVGANDLEPLTAKQLEELLASVDLVKNPDGLAMIDHALLPKRNLPTPSWDLGESYFEGDKVREAFLEGDHSYQVFDGKEKIEYEGVNKQATLFAEGASIRWVPTLRDFRFVPNPEAAYGLIDQRGGLVELSADEGLTRLTVESSSGAMRRCLVQSKTGQVLAETLQDGFTTYAGGIVFPTVFATARFGGAGTLSWIRITVLEEAQFNIPLPADTFTAAVPTGVNVFDQRDRDSIKTFKTASQSSDLALAANEHRMPQQPPLLSGWRLWVIGANALLLLVMVTGWLLWRWRSRRLNAR